MASHMPHMPEYDHANRKTRCKRCKEEWDYGLLPPETPCIEDRRDRVPEDEPKPSIVYSGPPRERIQYVVVMGAHKGGLTSVICEDEQAAASLVARMESSRAGWAFYEPTRSNLYGHVPRGT